MRTNAEAPLDTDGENRRIDAALGADPALSFACHHCGATPGRPCVNTLTHHPLRHTHDARAASSALPRSASELALDGMRAAVRKQLLAFCEEEVSASNLARLQRFCSFMGQAMIPLEKPDKLVRDRFGTRGLNMMNGSLPMPLPIMSSDPDEYGSGALAPAPEVETYGANATRSLIAEATKIGKDIMQMQADGQKAARRASSLPELVTALVLAKKQKLGKTVIQALEKQIAEAGQGEPAQEGA